MTLWFCEIQLPLPSPLSAPWHFNGLLVSLSVLCINFPVPQTLLFCHSLQWSLLTAQSLQTSHHTWKSSKPEALSSDSTWRCQHPMQAQKDKTWCWKSPFATSTQSSFLMPTTKFTHQVPVWCEEITPMASLGAQPQIIWANVNSSWLHQHWGELKQEDGNNNLKYWLSVRLGSE